MRLRCLVLRPRLCWFQVADFGMCTPAPLATEVLPPPTARARFDMSGTGCMSATCDEMSGADSGQTRTLEEMHLAPPRGPRRWKCAVLTCGVQACGTPHWMAPEVVTNVLDPKVPVPIRPRPRPLVDPGPFTHALDPSLMDPDPVVASTADVCVCVDVGLLTSEGG